MNARAEAERKLAPIIRGTSDDDLHDLWDRRHDLGPPRFVTTVEGLLLAAMADRGLNPPPLGSGVEPVAKPAPTADRDQQIVAAVLAGEPTRDVAARYGLSAGHVRRITAEARRAAGIAPASQSRPALRIVPNEPGEHLAAAERVLGPWTDALPDDRLAVASGDLIPKPPPVDLFGLFYSGRLNLIAGAPDTGKSYFVLQAAAEAATAGRVVWLDAEDSAAEFSARCLRLGCPELTTSDEVRRVNHSDWIAAAPEHIEACWQWLDGGFGPGLIVVDSGTGSGSGDSLDQWRAWTRGHLPPSGIGAILIEHVVKDPEQRHGQSAGSRGKLAAVRGMALVIDEIEGSAWAPATDTSPPRPGGFAAYVAKNKPGGGGWARGDRLGVLHGDPQPDGTLVVTVQVGGRAQSLIDAVARYVTDHPGHTTNAVVEALPGRKRDLSAAVRRAESDGLIIRIDGPNRAKLCYPPDHPEDPGGVR